MGITSRQIERRLGNGGLLREHRGVYRVGHRAPSVEAQYLAAVLACGQGALLSGRAAGHLFAVLRGPPPQPEVTTRTKRRVRGVTTRESLRITRTDATTWRGIPVTSVARTIVDLAGALGTDDLARACHEAGVRHRGNVRVTLSRLESRFLERLCEAKLVLPKTNRPAGGRRVEPS